MCIRDRANNEQLFTWPISNTLVNNRFYKGGNIAESKGTSKEKLDRMLPDETGNVTNLKQKKAFENIILLSLIHIYIIADLEQAL